MRKIATAFVWGIEVPWHTKFSWRDFGWSLDDFLHYWGCRQAGIYAYRTDLTDVEEQAVWQCAAATPPPCMIFRSGDEQGDDGPLVLYVPGHGGVWDGPVATPDLDSLTVPSAEERRLFWEFIRKTLVDENDVAEIDHPEREGRYIFAVRVFEDGQDDPQRLQAAVEQLGQVVGGAAS